MDQEWKWVATFLVVVVLGDAAGLGAGLLLAQIVGFSLSGALVAGMLLTLAGGMAAAAVGIRVADWVMTRVECREEVSRREGNQG